MREADRSKRRLVRWCGPILLGLLCLACVPMPVQVTPAVQGQVLDEVSDQPVEGAVVVVRFDVRHGDLLPDRDLLAHREATTDAKGRFSVPRVIRPGLGAWPMVRSEARIVGVIRDGYRCGSPLRVDGKPATLRIAPAKDLGERRASCRPVAARPDEAPAYLAAWRGLYPRDGRSGRMADERPLERLLEARRVFGPGDNCQGPAIDLALSPAGDRVAIALEERGRARIEVLSLLGSPKREAQLARPAEPDPSRPRRLAWNEGGELVLWEPAASLDRSLFARTPGLDAETVWQAPSMPAKQAPPLGHAGEPVHAADRHDEGAARWEGRSFHVLRSLDPLTGLGTAALRTHTPAGEEFTVELPGEACGPPGQYGRPQDRIAVGGRIGVDLRHVDGGCRAVAVHLETGEWRRLDGSRTEASCNETRRVPLPHLRAAMRGYVRDLEEGLRAAGGDPQASYRLRIGAGGRTTVESQSYLGERLQLVVAPFPVETPLRRIDVTSVGNAGEGSAEQPAPAAPAPSEPVLEPL